MEQKEQKITTKQKLNEMFFSNTKSAKKFDIILSILILISVTVIILESVQSIKQQIGPTLHALEIFFTAIFTIEYMLRIYSAENKKKYMLSFYGLVDFISIAPLYLGLLFPIARAASAIRILRLFRLFRFLKMFHIVDESNNLANAIKRSVPKIIVFVITVFFISVITGSILSIVETGEGFENIPEGIYFTVNILTTVGYADVLPVTIIGKILVGIIVLIGYGIIAVPTGIVTIELIRMHKKEKIKICGICKTPNESDANYCKNCGTSL
jgi:voltage-gated potassium channel